MQIDAKEKDGVATLLIAEVVLYDQKNLPVSEQQPQDSSTAMSDQMPHHNAQVGARQERPHTAAAPPRPTTLPMGPGEAKAVLRKVEMGELILFSLHKVIVVLLQVTYAHGHSRASLSPSCHTGV